MDELGKLAVKHLDKLINGPALPALPTELADDPDMLRLHEQMQHIRATVVAFATGDMSLEIKTRGFIAGNLKGLQAHLRHMIWQVQQVEAEDYTQRVAFLGEFSSAFNKMVLRLEDTLKTLRDNESELRAREQALRELADNLRAEVDLRTTAMEALKESEERFKYLASHDPLTGVYNRRAFMEQARWSLSNAISQDKLCSFSLMDIDNFKIFNDTNGHLAGDAALQHVARVAERALRKTDIMGRYGGEEFVFCFAGANLTQAMAVAERIRTALAGTPLTWEGEPKKLTASIGVTTSLPEDPERQICREQGECDEYMEYLINKADMHMYEAKKNGRDRVIGSLLAGTTDRRRPPRRVGSGRG